MEKQSLINTAPQSQNLLTYITSDSKFGTHFIYEYVAGGWSLRINPLREISGK